MIASKMKAGYLLNGNFVYEFKSDSRQVSNTLHAKGKKKRAHQKPLKGKRYSLKPS